MMKKKNRNMKRYCEKVFTAHRTAPKSPKVLGLELQKIVLNIANNFGPVNNLRNIEKNNNNIKLKKIRAKLQRMKPKKRCVTFLLSETM